MFHIGVIIRSGTASPVGFYVPPEAGVKAEAPAV
ncbi:hypothetical protein HG1285_12832 [Hydrogenivirga sp. 128-5-R1-1]|nr:hypothetical protein HG1285_12832 [Hydrogenivirga sp. 128-5-R1-1]